jgi:large subunit ribosomal protein L29
MIKMSELADLDDRGLEQKLGETKEEVFNLRFQNATGQLDNYRRLRELRRDVARIRMEMRRRELAGERGTEVRS